MGEESAFAATIPSGKHRLLREPHQVGILKKKYRPTKKNIRSGDHADMSGGSWPMPPMASSSAEMAQYTMPMPTPRAIPPTAPRLPTSSANGIANIMLMGAMSG